mmetsp:Transcript_30485/g.77129  ORF Transcript_30485/g.77129 Transcript_30485/m.77129 type:complete len:201 (-) Transcript_30485:160-762(-)
MLVNERPYQTGDLHLLHEVAEEVLCFTPTAAGHANGLLDGHELALQDGGSLYASCIFHQAITEPRQDVALPVQKQLQRCVHGGCADHLSLLDVPPEPQIEGAASHAGDPGRAHVHGRRGRKGRARGHQVGGGYLDVGRGEGDGLGPRRVGPDETHIPRVAAYCIGERTRRLEGYQAEFRSQSLGQLRGQGWGDAAEIGRI